jgi:hypothetical protein
LANFDPIAAIYNWWYKPIKPMTDDWCVDYYHYVVKTSYKDIVLNKEPVHDLHLMRRAYNDCANPKGGLFDRNDNVPGDLRVILPVVQNFLTSKGVVVKDYNNH